MDHGNINIGKKCVIRKKTVLKIPKSNSATKAPWGWGKREGRVKCRFAPQNGHEWRAAAPVHNSTSIAHEAHIITGTLFTERNSLPPLISRETILDVLSVTFTHFVDLTTRHDQDRTQNMSMF